VESLDAEIESMAGPKKKAKPQPKLVHLEEATSRHKQHITRLEQVSSSPEPELWLKVVLQRPSSLGPECYGLTSSSLNESWHRGSIAFAAFAECVFRNESGLPVVPAS